MPDTSTTPETPGAASRQSEEPFVILKAKHGIYRLISELNINEPALDYYAQLNVVSELIIPNRNLASPIATLTTSSQRSCLGE